MEREVEEPKSYADKIVIQAQKDQAQYQYWPHPREAGNENRRKISMQQGKTVRFTLGTDRESPSKDFVKAPFWIVVQRPSRHGPRMHPFQPRDKERRDEILVAPGVYKSVEVPPESGNHILDLVPASSGSRARGGLQFNYICSVEGCPPDDPDGEIDC